MVALSAVEASNSRISTALPASLVAVFVGATSGIGEYALKEFAQQAKDPKIYLVGRSEDAANRIIAESRGLNPTGQYTFIKSDISLLKNVDKVCQQILAKEDSINLLFQTQGTLLMESKTPPCYHRSISSNPVDLTLSFLIRNLRRAREVICTSSHITHSLHPQSSTRSPESKFPQTRRLSLRSRFRRPLQRQRVDRIPS